MFGEALELCAEAGLVHVEVIAAVTSCCLSCRVNVTDPDSRDVKTSRG